MRRAASATVALIAGGCAGGLAPRGPEAGRIAELFWLMLGMASLVAVLVLGILTVVVLRRGRADVSLGDDGLRRRFVIGGGILLPAVMLGGLMVPNVATMLAGASTGESRIEVVGHQYWWEVVYEDFTTANEIHIPAGARVELALSSDDVIHSVWVPELAGKVDMVPGRTTTMVIEADEPGRYVGRCAEFCGLQHAWMQFVVVAHEPGEYDEWYEAEAGDALEPSGEEELRGREVFLESSCVGCHSIRGVSESGEIAPDLTHIAAREELGAGVIDNTRDELTAWIVNPQTIKPGVRMPPQSLPAEDIDALVAYLESLE